MDNVRQFARAVEVLRALRGAPIVRATHDSLRPGWAPATPPADADAWKSPDATAELYRWAAESLASLRDLEAHAAIVLAGDAPPDVTDRAREIGDTAEDFRAFFAKAQRQGTPPRDLWRRYVGEGRAFLLVPLADPAGETARREALAHCTPPLLGGNDRHAAGEQLRRVVRAWVSTWKRADATAARLDRAADGSVTWGAVVAGYLAVALAQTDAVVPGADALRERVARAAGTALGRGARAQFADDVTDALLERSAVALARRPQRRARDSK